jgi:inner membrane protein
MPTVMTHPAAAFALFPWFRGQLGRPAVLIAGMLLTMAPDLDVIAFPLGIPYGHLLGHRGLSHSLPFALVFGALAAFAMARRYRMNFRLLWFYFSLCLASHGLLDAMTSGGLGAAFFSPFSNERYFFEFRPLRVSAIGVDSFLRSDWRAVLVSELWWVWLPAFSLGLAGLLVGRITRRITARTKDHE